MNTNKPHLEAETLYEYLDGELPADQLGALEAHLAQCLACSAQLARFQKLYSRLAEAPEQAPARDYTRPVLASLAALAKTRLSRRKTWRILDLSTAIQGLAALGLLWIAIPYVYQAFLARGLALLSTQAGGWLAMWPSALAGAWEQGRVAAQHGLERILDLPIRPGITADLPVFEIIVLLALATLVWLAGSGYLIGFWNNPSLRRKS